MRRPGYERECGSQVAAPEGPPDFSLSHPNDQALPQPFVPPNAPSGVFPRRDWRTQFGEPVLGPIILNIAIKRMLSCLL